MPSSPISIHSIYIGQPQTITDESGTWRSAIFRDLVEGPIHLGMRSLAGDQVADTDNHGRPTQAVCCHPMAHYDFWNTHHGMALRPGNVGENWTLDGADEAEICINDIYSVGEARIQVTGPRVPCGKQAKRVGHPDWVKLTLQELRTGFYLRVLTPGMVSAGDRWTLDERAFPGLTMHAINRSAYHEFDPALAERMRAVPDLHPYWLRKMTPA